MVKSPPPPSKTPVTKTPTPTTENVKKRDRRFITRKKANVLLINASESIRKAQQDLDRARDLAARAGLTIDSSIVKALEDDIFPRTTGGHSNTDHVVLNTGNPRADRIAELKRNLLRRARAMQPEHRKDDR